MNVDPKNDLTIIIHSSGVGTITRKMVRQRAEEIAIIDGRSAQEVSKSDWETAKRELVGSPEAESPEAILEALPESERWDPIAGSTGHEVPATSTDGDDSEGRSLGEKLVDDGMAEADHDQALQAARVARKNDE